VLARRAGGGDEALDVALVEDDAVGEGASRLDAVEVVVTGEGRTVDGPALALRIGPPWKR
jgi:hypothetical protein